MMNPKTLSEILDPLTKPACFSEKLEDGKVRCFA